MPNTLKNIKRQRQLFAYEKVSSVNRNKKEYASQVEKIGMMVYTNGLISAMAHLKAKGGAHKQLYDHFSEWFKREHSQIPFSMNQNDDLLKKLLDLNNSRTMMLLTKEAIQLSDAFKEMVKVKIKDTENGTD